VVERDTRRPPLLMVHQVHQEERQVVERIDGRHRFIELDGVIQHGAALPEHDVGKVDVAMAAAHKALPSPLIEDLSRKRQVPLGLAQE
jgi:hypothetical protein